MKFTLSEIASITQGQLFGDDGVVTGLSTDTRNLHEGDLFVALVGENFDPHELIEAGQASTANAVLVDRQLTTKCSQIVVGDTYTALQDLASAWRSKFSFPVVGITGSNGKTSVKELIKQILETQGNVLATIGNLNNHIGVPLTLARLDETHHYAVIEMGANHAGEIATLAQIAKPDIGVVTNIGPAHLEGFGSIEGVARAKSELYQNLNPQGIAVVNNDEVYKNLWKESIGDRMQITFGLEQHANVSCKKINKEIIEVSTPLGIVRVRLQALGEHTLYNVCAAVAVCLGLGVDLEDIKVGLERAKPVPGRLVRLTGLGGAQIWDDTYNANPASLFAALEVQSQEEGEHWLVLGEMAELGDEGEELHKKAGEMAKKCGVSRLFGLGSLTKFAVDAFGTGAEYFSTHKQLIETLQNEIYENVCVLVKGSRAMQMEKVVEGIRKNLKSESKCNEHAA